LRKDVAVEKTGIAAKELQAIAPGAARFET